MNFRRLLYIVVLFSGCNNADRATTTNNPDRLLCDSAHVDISAVNFLRTFSDGKLSRFYHYSYTISNGTSVKSTVIDTAGLVVEETEARARDFVRRYGDSFLKRGYTFFIREHNFGIDGKPDKIAILPATDKYKILQIMDVQAVNYDMDGDSVRRVIKKFDDRYDLQLIGADGDWCEFRIKRPPTDWLAFASEVEKICPDVVTQGAGDTKTLAEEMKKTRTLYLWWD